VLGNITEKIIVPGQTLLVPHLRKAAPVQQLATNLAVVGRGYFLEGFRHWGSVSWSGAYHFDSVQWQPERADR
jgi:hypothetical protein